MGAPEPPSDSSPKIVLGTPRRLPKASHLPGRVLVLDIAFAGVQSGGFEKVTLPFIRGLGDRLRAWVDHHDHDQHVQFRDDPRFVLAKKSDYGACPEMISPELVARIGPIDTICCHDDFDGLASAAKWIRGGHEPYPGCDADARCIDTRIGEPSALASTMDRALRARPKDQQLRVRIVRVLASGTPSPTDLQELRSIAAELLPIERDTRLAASRYQLLAPSVAAVDVTDGSTTLDKTLLLLLGQELAAVAVVVDRNTVSVATRFDSGANFLTLFGVTGGMPTRVALSRADLPRVLGLLGVPTEAAARFAAR